MQQVATALPDRERRESGEGADSVREYRTMDKGGWGDGPWQAEPDKIQFVDAATGLDCLAVRNHWGAWCGYVGVAEGHPWFGLGYSDPLPGVVPHERDSYYDSRIDGVIEVHGGLSYSDFCQQDGPEESAICHVALPGRPERVFWYGFDCGHSGDYMPGWDTAVAAAIPSPYHSPDEEYRTLAYVREQCASLAAQLAAVADGGTDGR